MIASTSKGHTLLYDVRSFLPFVFRDKAYGSSLGAKVAAA